MQFFQKDSLFFFTIPVIWGLTFPLIKISVMHISPSVFVFLRFILATIFCLPLIVFQKRVISRKLVLQAFLLGLLNAAVFDLQTMGLQHISAPQSAFITALCVVFVPFLTLFFRRSAIKSIDFLAGILCLLGIYVLTGANISHLNIGHLETLLCAIASAATIIMIHRVSEKAVHLIYFSFLQIAFTALCIFPTIFFVPHVLLDIAYAFTHLQVIVTLLYCVFLATMLAWFLQVKFQQHVGECKAALILALEPIFASVFSVLFFYNPITKHLFIGGMIVLLSIVLSDLQLLFVRRKID